LELFYFGDVIFADFFRQSFAGVRVQTLPFSQPLCFAGVSQIMNSDAAPKSNFSWLRTILLLLVIVGLLAAIAVPNFVGGGPSKTSGIINILRNVDAAKEQWAIEHGYNNKMSPAREITAQDITPFFYHEDGKNPLTRLGLVIDKDGNLRNPQGVVFVINPLGFAPEVKFAKAFKLSDHSGFFGPKIPKGTVMRFSTNADDIVEYVLPGQESKPCKSLSELLAR
jgi:hypothetical protein